MCSSAAIADTGMHGKESRKSMTAPLAILAFFAIALGLIGTPAWPWFHAFIEEQGSEL